MHALSITPAAALLALSFIGAAAPVRAGSEGDSGLGGVAAACPNQTLAGAHANFPATDGFQWVTTDDEAIVKRLSQLILNHLADAAFKSDDVKTIAVASHKKYGNHVEIGLFDKNGCYVYAIFAPADQVMAIIGEDT